LGCNRSPPIRKRLRMIRSRIEKAEEKKSRKAFDLSGPFGPFSVTSK
jgi:hypothetical protein